MKQSSGKTGNNKRPILKNAEAGCRNMSNVAIILIDSDLNNYKGRIFWQKENAEIAPPFKFDDACSRPTNVMTSSHKVKLGLYGKGDLATSPWQRAEIIQYFMCYSIC